MPYRTLDNVIDGVVMTFSDITELKAIEAELKGARDYARSIIDTIREPLVVLNGNAKVISASQSFYRTFGVTAEDTVGRSLFSLGTREWDIPELHELLDGVLTRDETFENFMFEHEFPAIGRRKLILNARRIVGKEGTKQLILLSMDTVMRTDENTPGTAGRTGD